MEKYFTIGEAAKEAHVTAETLRHYDRIGLVAPSRREENTGYRYYTQEDIVRLHTVRALQQMDLPLKKIREVLQENDLRAVITFLDEAEKRLADKIAMLQRGKEKIGLARASYAEKLRQRENAQAAIVRVREFPPRAILVSNSLETATVDTLFDYLRHFYDALAPSEREAFAFEDAAGILRKSGKSRMFAVCVRYVPNEAVEILPAGRYLCADCTEDNKDEVVERLMREADAQWGARPQFAVLMVFLSGVLQWSYQAQVYTGDAGARGNSSGNVDAPRKKLPENG